MHAVPLHSSKERTLLWSRASIPKQYERQFETLSAQELDFVVERWGEYKSDVPNLGPNQIATIDRAADRVVASLDSPFPIRAMLLQGHADLDARRTGKAREDFEAQISLARANEVLERLQGVVTRRDLSTTQAINFAKLQFRTQGLGSIDRVNKNPKTEIERSANRRVVAFVARAAPEPKPARVLLCPRGGSVLPVAITAGPAKARDVWRVVGCPFQQQIGNGFQPSPCVSVIWLSPPDAVIDATSLGMCVSNAGVPQGTVVISL
ncbi:hypothetical protein BH11PSE13_BH11PSE13_09140 [soil metagenome]